MSQSTTHTSAHSFTNRLAREKSPYLLQHQHNPVDWFPWGEEAFTKARGEGKPIFLSIGYSTCHWCHVMERESFENHEVAAYLNTHFVSIKVDREERPDVDKIYMTAVQGMGQGGGWPLNVFLTPELKPFYGGTYFPPEPKFGRPSFLQLLQRIQEMWSSRRQQLTDSAAEIHARLEQFVARAAPPNSVFDHDTLRRAAEACKQEYDPRYGGFGDAPKFPRPSQPAFLLSWAARHHDTEAVNMVLHTCERMAAGGMNDQLGGGFARYSVDSKWLVPHFEKMLYDNAQLLHLYLDAWLVSGRSEFAQVARDILTYLQRDMTHKEGGFYSAEDADSEGKEGKFYCWTKVEMKVLLAPEEFEVAVRYFGVTDRGNFSDHSDPNPLPDQNVLSIVDSKLTSTEAALLKSAKRKMLAARAKRVRPHLDDKILASWNGLMLGATARAGVVLGEPAYLKAAERCAAFIQAKLWDASSKTLYHRWRDGERDSVQILEAYAFLLSGMLDLYEATLQAPHLEFSLALAETMIAKFYDPEAGGFWQSPGGAADLILRVKEDYDGAEPSGNSVAILSLLRLGAITDRKDFKAAAEKSLRLFAQRLQQLPQAVPLMLQALAFQMEEPRRAVVAGRPDDPRTRELLAAVHSVYQPHKVVLSNQGPVEAFALTLKERGGPAVYLCTGTSCLPPSGDPGTVRTLIK